MTDDATLSLVSVRAVAAKPDGTPRRNIYEVDVLVDGVPHIIRIRRQNGTFKNMELATRPDWPAIESWLHSQLHLIADRSLMTMLAYRMASRKSASQEQQ